MSDSSAAQKMPQPLAAGQVLAAPVTTLPKAPFADPVLTIPFADSNTLFSASSTLASSLSLKSSASPGTSFGLVLPRGLAAIPESDEACEADSEMDETTSVSGKSTTSLVSRDKGKGKAVDRGSEDLEKMDKKEKKDLEKLEKKEQKDLEKEEKKKMSAEKKKARARSKSPAYILPNGMTFAEFIQFIVDRKIRMPDPSWDTLPPSKFEDYVTIQNPRLGIEIDRAMGGKFLAEFKKRIFPIELVKPFIRRTIIKHAMVVPYCAPWEYYADFLLASSAHNPPRPNVALLRVNKSIGYDAAMYLYTFNTFVFKSPDYFILFMLFMSVANLLCMEWEVQITLCEPFPMIMRSFEAHWLIKNMKILNGVMIGDLSDDWDKAYYEFLAWAGPQVAPAPDAEDDTYFATDAEVARAMKAFGVVGHPKRLRPLSVLMKEKEVMVTLFPDEYWASFEDAGVADVLEPGDTEIYEDEIGKVTEVETKKMETPEGPGGDDDDDNDDGESVSSGEETETEETVRGRAGAPPPTDAAAPPPPPARVHHYGPLGHLCQARLRDSVGSSLAGMSSVASSSTGRTRSSWETVASGSTQK